MPFEKCGLPTAKKWWDTYHKKIGLWICDYFLIIINDKKHIQQAVDIVASNIIPLELSSQTNSIKQ